MPRNRPTTAFSFFFERKVPAVIWGLILVGFGLVSYNGMKKEALPDLDIPTFYVTTRWEGANSAMVEKSVTQKIEKALRTLPDVKNVRSASVYSFSFVIVTFKAECAARESQQRLRQQLSTVRGDLPKTAKEPKIEPSTVNDIPIATVALSGDVSVAVLESLCRDLAKTIRRIPGIRKADPIGTREEIVHVQLYPERLKEYGIPASEVRQRIAESGEDAPWGRFEGRDIQFSLRMSGVYTDLDRLRLLHMGKRFGGGTVRLQDIALVSRSHMSGGNKAALSWEGGGFEPVVGLSLLKASGYDTMNLVAAVEEALRMAQTQSRWPVGVTWRLTGNQSEMIQTELDRGLANGWQAMLAVFCVLLMLLTWREAMVAALSIPLTLLGTVTILWAMGYTFNLLVIVGMVIALGLLVDDFILIMEGMHDGIYIQGLSFAKAVRYTISTFAVPSFSGSVTTILVFAPLAFISGVDGKFLRVIPVTAAVCLMVSFTVSVLMGPPLLRPFLGRSGDHGPNAVDRISHKLESRLADWLGRVVVPTRKRALAWLVGAMGAFVLSLIAALAMRTTLYPDEDGRTIGISVELAEATPIEATALVAERLSPILRGKPYIQSIMRVVGGKDSYSMSSSYDYMENRDTSHVLSFGCYLVPGTERDRLAVEYVDELRREFLDALKDEPGAQVFINAARGGPTGEDPVQVEIIGPDLDALRDIARKVRELLRATPGIYDIRDNIGPIQSELQYTPMPEALEHHGLSQPELAAQMMVYMENEKVANFQRPGTEEDLDVRIGAWWTSQQGKMGGPKSWHELARLAIINQDGDAVPLESITTRTMVTAMPTIIHTDGQRSVTVLAKNQGTYVPEVLARLRPVMDDMREQWPDGFSYKFVGEEEADQTYSDMFMAFIGAIILVYAILSLLFDSLALPLIILSTVLFSLIGVFFGFMVFGLPFSFSAAIGMVALVGIVVNDAIIVVETIRNHTRNGLPIREAARRGAADRLRPITSTTLTNFAGLLPLAFSDPGWAPICQAIIFGEITATAGAVTLIPAIYILLVKNRTEERIRTV